MEKPDKRKLVNWEEKSDTDDERISDRLNKRTDLTNKSTAKPATVGPAATGGAPAPKVRKKIKETYDEEEDEDDLVNAPFFNISLIEDDELEMKKNEKKEKETLSITKEQQLVSKLNIVMNTALDAEEMGLSSKLTKKDFNRINDAEYNPGELKSKTVKEKIVQPLESENNPRPTMDTLKNLAKELPDDSSKGLFVENEGKITQTEEQEEMAKLILEKSGRLKSKKSISEIAAESESIKKALMDSNEKE